MLVLSRKVGEEVVIGDNVRVTIVAVSGNQVRLGFQAPEHIAIFRDEVIRKPGHSRTNEPCVASR